ncbi:hypothetical protein NKG05_15575 [Oerskovia sp. M15]
MTTTNPPYRLALLDLDGTLTDSAPASSPRSGTPTGPWGSSCRPTRPCAASSARRSARRSA